MPNKNLRSLETIITLRTSLLETAISGVVLALGINLIAAGVVVAIGLPGWIITLLGLICCALAIAYLLTRVKPANSRRFEFEGAFLLRKGDDREVYAIPRYDFSEEIARYFRGLCAENQALARQWQNSPLALDDSRLNETTPFADSAAHELVREAIEYFVLDKLSMHLSGYFINNGAISDKEIVRIGREDLPGRLLQNRFLELFSTPMEHREAFERWPRDIRTSTIASAWAEHGEIFRRFQLILPKGSKISRPSPFSLLIQTPRFNLQIQPLYEGVNINLPKRFEELYLGTSFFGLSRYRVGLVIEVEFQLLSLFLANGWEYYHWLDSFLDELGSSFSLNRFIDNIGWSTALSAAIAVEHLDQKNREDTSSSSKE